MDEARLNGGIVKWVAGGIALIFLMFAVNTINAPDAEFNDSIIATATSRALARALAFVPTPTPPGVDTPVPPTPLIVNTPEPVVESPDMTDSAGIDTAASMPDTSQTQYIKHTIQGGDTLYAISVNYGVNVNDIVAVNDSLNPNYLLIGDVINVPVNDNNRELIATETPANQLVQLDVTPASGFSSPGGNDPTNRLGVFPIAGTSDPFVLTLTPFVRQKVLNDIPIEEFVVLPRSVLLNSREIFRQGVLKGNNPKAFAKMGDSTVENPFFMDRFDEGPYNLGDYSYLQATIDWFRGSFNRDSVAVRVGFHSWSAFDPMWASRAECEPGEGALACEIRVMNPSFLFVRLGSNDLGVPTLFEESMRKIIEFCIERGVVPIIGTKGDRAEGSNINNEILRKLAAEYEVPLWDYDLLAATIPGRGLGTDGVHMNTWYAHDYTDPTAFRRGHGVHSLGALIMLDAIINQIIQPDNL